MKTGMTEEEAKAFNTTYTDKDRNEYNKLVRRRINLQIKAEINDMTNFVKHSKFTSPKSVRNYFKLNNLYNNSRVNTFNLHGVSQDELDEQAELVIQHKWNCNFAKNN
ncbi:MAG: hypothetical protein ACYC0V_00565 [Armatimonadota bacterium]